MSKLLLVGLMITLSLSLFAADKKGISVDVSLSPAGSFTIKSSKVKGKVIKDAEGKISAKNLKISVKTLKSGIDMRDEHMLKRLESGSHKKIEILKAIGKNGKGAGIILIKGIKKKFKFTYKEMGKLVKASFKLSLKDFKIKDLSYMGVGVEDKVTVTALVPLK